MSAAKQRMLPMSPSADVQRRQRVLKVIGMGLATTLLVALVTRTRVAWGVHLLVHDLFLAGLDRAGERAPQRRPRLTLLRGEEDEPVAIVTNRRRHLGLVATVDEPMASPAS